MFLLHVVVIYVCYGYGYDDVLRFSSNRNSQRVIRRRTCVLSDLATVCSRCMKLECVSPSPRGEPR